MALLCKKYPSLFVLHKKSLTFVTANEPVPWMSGLVSGLQNHVRRFESARYLRKSFSY